jgi:hypothetical protein
LHRVLLSVFRYRYAKTYLHHFFRFNSPEQTAKNYQHHLGLSQCSVNWPRYFGGLLSLLDTIWKKLSLIFFYQNLPFFDTCIVGPLGVLRYYIALYVH